VQGAGNECRRYRFISAVFSVRLDYCWNHAPEDQETCRHCLTAAGFERIFYSTFYFARDLECAEAIVITRTSFRFVKDFQLWYVKDDPSEETLNPHRPENLIVLSEEFWREIQDRSIPVDLTVVRALADSPGNLDLRLACFALLDG
jgi:hypothetical protein